MTIDRYDCGTARGYELAIFAVMRKEDDGDYVKYDDHILALKEERQSHADKFQHILDVYIDIHKLDWNETDEAARDTLKMVINELRSESATYQKTGDI